MSNNIKKLAKILIDYSIDLKKDEKVLISFSPESSELAQQIYQMSLKKGAFPRLNVSLDGFDYLFFKNAQKKHLTASPEVGIFLANWADKFVRLVSNLNDRELASIDPKKIMTRTKASEPIKDIMLKKPWILTYWPTHSMAQSAGMSLPELKEIYFNSCLQNWSKMNRQLKKLKKAFDQASEVKVVGKKTNLSFSLHGRLAEAASGKHNMPDGEVFAAPVDTSAQGEIYFDMPSLYQGKIVENVYLKFKKGLVVSAQADRGQQTLGKALETDPGARRLGEFAIGTNYGIKKAMLNTLFDEKIGGTIHMALGNAYPDKEGGGTNRSAIHWDLVKDMRLANHQVLFDGQPVLKEGKILV